MIELDCKTVLVDGCLSSFKLWIQHDVVVDVVGLLLDDSTGFKIKVWQGMAWELPGNLGRRHGRHFLHDL
jgi:hypothetical protein